MTPSGDARACLCCCHHFDLLSPSQEETDRQTDKQTRVADVGFKAQEGGKLQPHFSEVKLNPRLFGRGDLPAGCARVQVRAREQQRGEIWREKVKF